MSAVGLIITGAIVALVYWVWARTRRSGARAIALSEYAQRLSVDEAKYVHDLAVSSFGAFAPPNTDPMKDIELAAALRDRVDQLEGRPAGSSNRAAIRTALVRAVSSRSKPFRYGIQPSPANEELWGDHYTMMGRVYLHLDQAHPLPERD